MPRRKEKVPIVCKRGKMTEAEHHVVEALVADVIAQGEQPVEVLQKRGVALGIVLRRSPEAIRDAIIKAQEKLSDQAEEYVDLHLQASRIAAAIGNPEPAQWMLERLTAPGADGKSTLRIVGTPATAVASGPTGPTINIGVALGGRNSSPARQAAATATEVIDVGDPSAP